MSSSDINPLSGFVNSLLGCNCTWTTQRISKDMKEEERCMSTPSMSPYLAHDIEVAMKNLKLKIGKDYDTAVNPSGERRLLLNIKVIEKLKAQKEGDQKAGAGSASKVSDLGRGQFKPDDYRTDEQIAQMLSQEDSKISRSAGSASPGVKEPIEKDPRKRIGMDFTPDDIKQALDWISVINEYKLFKGQDSVNSTVDKTRLNIFIQNQNLPAYQHRNIDEIENITYSQIKRDNEIPGNFVIHFCDRENPKSQAAVSLNKKQMDELFVMLTPKGESGWKPGKRADQGDAKAAAEARAVSSDDQGDRKASASAAASPSVVSSRPVGPSRRIEENLSADKRKTAETLLNDLQKHFDAKKIDAARKFFRWLKNENLSFEQLGNFNFSDVQWNLFFRPIKIFGDTKFTENNFIIKFTNIKNGNDKYFSLSESQISRALIALKSD